jgi:hypothetical protein
MTEKMDFSQLGKEAAENEPSRSSNESVNIESDISPESAIEDEKPEFQADAKFFTSFVVGFVDTGIVFIFGEKQENALSDNEKTGFNDLFERGAEHFRVSKQIEGTPGFFVELFGRVFSAFGKRLMTDEGRKAFFSRLKTKKKTEKTEEQEQEKYDQPFPI